LDTWYQWYQQADPAERPFPANRLQNLVFYRYTDAGGAKRYIQAWKFDNDYPRVVNLPSAGHEIAPGSEIGQISTKVVEGSELAKKGVPVGAQLAYENGTGALVMVLEGKVRARVDDKGVWQVIQEFNLDPSKMTTEKANTGFLRKSSEHTKVC
jgi:hypothetical protein